MLSEYIICRQTTSLSRSSFFQCTLTYINIETQNTFLDFIQGGWVNDLNLHLENGCVLCIYVLFRFWDIWCCCNDEMSFFTAFTLVWRWTSRLPLTSLHPMATPPSQALSTIVTLMNQISTPDLYRQSAKSSRTMTRESDLDITEFLLLKSCHSDALLKL